MKIIKNNKVYFGLCVAAIGLTALHTKYENNRLADIKNEIKAKDPERYNRLIKDEQENGDITIIWQGERDLMNDSLRLDSAMKKAYFEGAQMVRDSINSANKQEG